MQYVLHYTLYHVCIYIYIVYYTLLCIISQKEGLGSAWDALLKDVRRSLDTKGQGPTMTPEVCNKHARTLPVITFKRAQKALV